VTVSRVVEIFADAERDLHRSGVSIRTTVSGESAKRWIAKLCTAIDGLAETADRYPEADESAAVGLNLRMRIVGNRSHVYRILFTIVGDTVLVHRVRHAAQDYLTEDDL